MSELIQKQNQETSSQAKASIKSDEQFKNLQAIKLSENFLKQDEPLKQQAIKLNSEIKALEILVAGGRRGLKNGGPETTSQFQTGLNRNIQALEKCTDELKKMQPELTTARLRYEGLDGVNEVERANLLFEQSKSVETSSKTSGLILAAFDRIPSSIKGKLLTALHVLNLNSGVNPGKILQSIPTSAVSAMVQTSANKVMGAAQQIRDGVNTGYGLVDRFITPASHASDLSSVENLKSTQGNFTIDKSTEIIGLNQVAASKPTPSEVTPSAIPTGAKAVPEDVTVPSYQTITPKMVSDNDLEVEKIQTANGSLPGHVPKNPNIKIIYPAAKVQNETLPSNLKPAGQNLPNSEQKVIKQSNSDRITNPKAQATSEGNGPTQAELNRITEDAKVKHEARLDNAAISRTKDIPAASPTTPTKFSNEMLNQDLLRAIRDGSFVNNTSPGDVKKAIDALEKLSQNNNARLIRQLAQDNLTGIDMTQMAMEGITFKELKAQLDLNPPLKKSFAQSGVIETINSLRFENKSHVKFSLISLIMMAAVPGSLGLGGGGTTSFAHEGTYTSTLNTAALPADYSNIANVVAGQLIPNVPDAKFKVVNTKGIVTVKINASQIIKIEAGKLTIITKGTDGNVTAETAITNPEILKALNNKRPLPELKDAAKITIPGQSQSISISTQNLNAILSNNSTNLPNNLQVSINGGVENQNIIASLKGSSNPKLESEVDLFLSDPSTTVEAVVAYLKNRYVSKEAKSVIVQAFDMQLSSATLNVKYPVLRQLYISGAKIEKGGSLDISQMQEKGDYNAIKAAEQASVAKYKKILEGVQIKYATSTLGHLDNLLKNASTLGEMQLALDKLSGEIKIPLIKRLLGGNQKALHDEIASIAADLTTDRQKIAGISQSSHFDLGVNFTGNVTGGTTSVESYHNTGIQNQRNDKTIKDQLALAAESRKVETELGIFFAQVKFNGSVNPDVFTAVGSIVGKVLPAIFLTASRKTEISRVVNNVELSNDTGLTNLQNLNQVLSAVNEVRNGTLKQTFTIGGTTVPIDSIREIEVALRQELEIRMKNDTSVTSRIASAENIFDVHSMSARTLSNDPTITTGAKTLINNTLNEYFQKTQLALKNGVTARPNQDTSFENKILVTGAQLRAKGFIVGTFTYGANGNNEFANKGLANSGMVIGQGNQKGLETYYVRKSDLDKIQSGQNGIFDTIMAACNNYGQIFNLSYVGKSDSEIVVQSKQGSELSFGGGSSYKSITESSFSAAVKIEPKKPDKPKDETPPVKDTPPPKVEKLIPLAPDQVNGAAAPVIAAPGTTVPPYTIPGNIVPAPAPINGVPTVIPPRTGVPGALPTTNLTVNAPVTVISYPAATPPSIGSGFGNIPGASTVPVIPLPNLGVHVPVIPTIPNGTFPIPGSLPRSINLSKGLFNGGIPPVQPDFKNLFK